jgi:hypothetical protein
MTTTTTTKGREGKIWAEEIASMYPDGQLDVSRAAYKQVQDIATVGEGDARVRYKFSIVAVPLHKDVIKLSPYGVKCEFIGFINHPYHQHLTGEPYSKVTIPGSKRAKILIHMLTTL